MILLLSFLRKQESREGVSGQVATGSRGQGLRYVTRFARQLQNAQSMLGRLAAARFPSPLTFDTVRPMTASIQYEIERKEG